MEFLERDRLVRRRYLILYNPLLGIAAFTLVLAAFFFAQGITQIFASLSHRRVLRSWGWVFLSGLVDLVLGGLIVSGWPGTSTWVIGLLVGINLFMVGIALIMTAFASRDVAQLRRPEATAPRAYALLMAMVRQAHHEG